MKKIFIITLGIILTGISAVQNSNAQSNLVQELNFQLCAVMQGDTRTNKNVAETKVKVVREGCREIIQALGLATTNNFSRKAKLLLVTSSDGSGSPSILVQDCTNSVDVTGFFGIQQTGSSVDSSWSNCRNGSSSSHDYSIQTYTLRDQDGYSALPFHFSVSGFTIKSSSTLVNHKGTMTVEENSFEANVCGTGDSNGNQVLIQGSISAEPCSNHRPNDNRHGGEDRD
ncbi:hypothetical protein [Pedosphaera parvula]|uniref:Uncharacterized protein n=1 Tax=Pedosphaera parvula (strain Ellin514) TaxID=320771 RepID=B9XLU3_PEDPL|nr:hypothetical protein [Pedosphaera parvula]EEF59200.1 hypothetical protein Cflav_PD2405 [Pedosphaera parvula Ellin514]